SDAENGPIPLRYESLARSRLCERGCAQGTTKRAVPLGPYRRVGSQKVLTGLNRGVSRRSPPVYTLGRWVGRRVSVHREGSQRLLARVIQRPEGVQRGHVQQLTRLGGSAGDDHLAAVLLDALVAAQQERQEDRAEVVHLAQVEDQPGGRIGLE